MSRPPRAGSAASFVVQVRVTPVERAAWVAAAARDQANISEWIRALAKRRIEFLESTR